MRIVLGRPGLGLLTLGVLVLGVLTLGPFVPTARAEDAPAETCTGRFALCAASTCKPAGKSIQVNVAGGGTARFPQYDCQCPIESGPATANLHGGTMKGSCAAPAAKRVWSLFAPLDHIPQAMDGWETTETATKATPQTCAASLGLGSNVVNCFSFACSAPTKINGVEVATCHCAAGAGLDGKPIPTQTAFLTKAGQGDPAFCAQHPVGRAIP